MKAASTDSVHLSDSRNARTTRDGGAEAGMVLIFACGLPYCTLLPLGPAPLELGRGQGALAEHPDSLMSRMHARVSYCEGRFTITDLGSRNGSAVEGIPLRGTTTVGSGVCLRLGGSLFLLHQDIRAFRQFSIKRTEHRVQGPTLQNLQSIVSHIAESSRTLFISGESGTGKESLAQAFHRASSQRAGPFVAVNCAAIPEGIAERLLFGARKGAFSGIVSDSDGYIDAANGGTLFLDEVADLDGIVQGKLLRVIESGELLALGATRPRKVQFRVCAATHKDLRALTQEKRFRADLYFRIGMPHVTIPPLRERREEIPWLMAGQLGALMPGVSLDVSIVEACMLRAWPGNVRELLAETNTAAMTARAAGKSVVFAEHLSLSAGAPMTPSPASQPEWHTPPRTSSAEDIPPAQAPEVVPALPVVKGASPSEVPSRKQILSALVETHGNISAAARTLQIHRTQFRRLLLRYRIDVDKLRDLGKL
jgi:transcriptional regulator with GAF, ATPase, and Fis domain